MDRLDHLPTLHREYLLNLNQNLQDVLQASLIGFYLFGSAPSPASYQPGLSDLDIAAVIKSPQSRSTYMSLISRITHASLPCPARKLEFVLYTEDAVKPATRFPKFELNFNTGEGMQDHASFEVVDEAGHWFLLDIAMGRDLGIKVWGEKGADVKEVFGEPTREWVVDGVAESIRWYKMGLQTSNEDGVKSEIEIRERERELVDAVLNASRGLRWAMTQQWGSKVEGGEWAVKQEVGGVGVVRDALNAKINGAGGVGRPMVIEFLGFVEAEVKSMKKGLINP